MKQVLLVCLLLGLAACSAKNVDKNNSEETASTIQLTRTYQRVIRYDCNNQPISDKVETVGTPTELVRIAPNTTVDFYNVSYENTNLGTRPNCLYDRFSFNVDYSEGWCNMRVESGVNKLRYRFYYCDSVREDGTCTHAPELREEGFSYINVNYKSEELSGFTEIKPSEEQCNPK